VRHLLTVFLTCVTYNFFFPSKVPTHLRLPPCFYLARSLVNMELTISELSSELARLPSMMVVGDVNQTSSTRSEPFHHPSHASHLRNDSTGPSPRGAQSTPSIAAPASQHAPHIRFRGAPPHEPPQQRSDHLYHQTNHLLAEDPHSATESAMPPPSPRLEPTHRSTLSLNGSVANSPSRIKVRDLGHIQSFASEEVLARSRHPSRHSLRGRLAGGQQYEISSMPVGDIIEMVAGLLTKITTTVGCQPWKDFHYNVLTYVAERPTA
jgi:hypothetical protein